MSAANVIQKFAQQQAGVKLSLRETLSRDAIVVQGRRRTLGYVNVGKELWGQLLVDRFNVHEELLDALRQILRVSIDPEGELLTVSDIARAAIDKGGQS